MIRSEDIQFKFDEPGGIFGTDIVALATLRVQSRGVVRQSLIQKSRIDLVEMMKAQLHRSIFETVYGELRHPLMNAIYAADLVGDRELADQLHAVVAKLEGR